LKEKELRIALVCFGGVSLAVYMHGITKEVLKLVRASGVLHAIRDRNERSQASFFDRVEPGDPEYDTDAIYFELLRDIGRIVELRVIVDIVAGASAGGINGTMLARALSHDLPMGALRDLWLENADVTELLSPEARAGATSKLILKPIIWLLGATGLWQSIKDPEVRRKLSLFVRSRWFRPPLSGQRMADLMYSAVTAMGKPTHASASLLPSGQGLELFVTVTDHYGYQQPVQIHDPPIIHEREHRHILHFRYQRRPNGEVISDFTFDNAPALAFAARATSSFPGAFPPTQIKEIDELVARKSVAWPHRAEFIARNFEPYTRIHVDPTSACFLDGSVLNNRPFRAATSAIRGRPAYRQVDRRLVYIDPDPASPGGAAARDIPGFFTTLKGALSDLPSAEPVTDELAWVNTYNDRVNRLRAIIEDSRPHISQLVADIVTASFDQTISADQVRGWREQVNFEVAANAGFAYEGYVRLKLASVRSFVSSLIAEMRGVPAHSPFGRAIAEIINAWTVATGTRYGSEKHRAVHLETAKTDKEVPPWVKFLLAFDVDYRKRRLHFLIEGQNRLYQVFDQPHFAGYDRAVVDRLKRSFYGCLDVLSHCENINNFDAATRDLVLHLFATEPRPADAEDLENYARIFVECRGDRIDLLIERMAAQINLDACTNDVDMLLAATDPREWHPDARHDAFVNYLGFPFWDVLTFPLMTWREVGEFNRILVDRISPMDANTLTGFCGTGSLKGIGFAHFAAFFSRAYRENDYLLGRLHAIDRLIDIVCDSAGFETEEELKQVLALKQRGFRTILDAEEKHLPNSGGLIAALRRCIDGLTATASASERKVK
jgi:patatin-related protein